MINSLFLTLLLTTAQDAHVATSTESDAIVECIVDHVRFPRLTSFQIDDVIDEAWSSCADIVSETRAALREEGLSQEAIEEHIEIRRISMREVLTEDLSEYLNRINIIRGRLITTARETQICSVRVAYEYKDLADRDINLLFDIVQEECVDVDMRLIELFEDQGQSRESALNHFAFTVRCTMEYGLYRAEISPEIRDGYEEVCDVLSERFGIEWVPTSD